MGSIVGKLRPEKDDMMHWHTQAGNITTNYKVTVDCDLLTISTTNVVTWKCHVDDSAKVRYDMIFGRDLWTELGLNLRLYEHVIKEYDGTFKESTTPIVELGTNIFKNLNTGKITPEVFY